MHAQVRSNASRSPVSYNAFDPKLQLWVAAYLYRYYVDMHESLYGPLDDGRAADAIYLDARTARHHASRSREAHVAGRTAPRSTSSGSARWIELRFDPPVPQSTFAGSQALVFLPCAAFGLSAGHFNLFATTGFLSCRGFREHMGSVVVPPAQQRRFEWLLGGLRLADRVIPQRSVGSWLPALPVGHAGPRPPRQNAIV